MSLNKSIYYKKDKRKQYKGAKSFDYSCQNHGSCSYCSKGRRFFDLKKRKAIELDEKDFWK